MATPTQKRSLSSQPRRVLDLLKLLASSPHGATEALLVRVHGFDSDMVAGLVRAGVVNNASGDHRRSGALDRAAPAAGDDMCGGNPPLS